MYRALGSPPILKEENKSKEIKKEPGEMIQQLGELAALLENPKFSAQHP